MRNLFNHYDRVKEALSLRPFGLFTDVDGTISEIAPSPGQARVSPGCRESLALLARRLDVVAAVSGRTAIGTRDMVGVDDMIYIGNHGYERWVDGKVQLMPGIEPYIDSIKSVLAELEKRIAVEGVIFENKGPTASIHYRRCRDQEAALKAIMTAVEEFTSGSDLRVSRGRLVVELRPPLEVNKGTAVLSLVEERQLRGALYLGDDLTDVDVFVAFHREGLPFKGLAVAVIEDETASQVIKAADYILNGVREVERFLKRVAAEATDRPAA
ncbi:MAG: trehalose-phosphatase [Dehalococcoidia bacterium]|nr:MAG: trehalose-phosphatase [Dehalococcoidia bacterium]